MNREQRLAETFVELADTLVDDFDVIDFLQVLAARCVELLDVGAAGIMLAAQGDALVTVAASDERARLLELFEIQNDEGPCRDCYRLGAAVVNVDLDGARTRWPLFVPRAIAAGFSCANALPLRLRGQIVGSLNLFHAGTADLDGAELRMAQALADAATMGIVQQRTVHRSEVAAAQLQAALTRRIVIEQARASSPSGCRSGPMTHSSAARSRPLPQPAAVRPGPRCRRRLPGRGAATAACLRRTQPITASAKSQLQGMTPCASRHQAQSDRQVMHAAATGWGVHCRRVSRRCRSFASRRHDPGPDRLAALPLAARRSACCPRTEGITHPSLAPELALRKEPGKRTVKAKLRTPAGVPA